MEALQVITDKKKILAERKVRQDKEKILQKQAAEEHRQALAALQAARQQRELNINNNVMEKLSVDQLEGREILFQSTMGRRSPQRRTNPSTPSTPPREPRIISRRGLICRHWDTRMTTCCTANLQVRSTCK